MNRRPRLWLTGVLAIAGALLTFHTSANPPARSEEAVLVSRIGDQAEIVLKRGFHTVADDEATTAFYAIDLELSTRESDGQGEFVRGVTRLLHCDSENVNIVRSTNKEMVMDFHFTPDDADTEESLIRLTAFKIAPKKGDPFWKLTTSGSGVAYEPFTNRLEDAIAAHGGEKSKSLATAHWTSHGMAEDLSSLAGITVQKQTTVPASCGDVYQLRWHDHGKYERLVLDLAAFDLESDPEVVDELAVPGTYRVDYERYPCRVVFDLVARGFRASADLPNFAEESSLIEGLHRIPVLDDGTVMFALTLKGPAEIEVFDLHGPARIVVDVRAARESADATDVKYSLRSPAHEAGETVGSLEEQLLELKPRNLRVLRTQAGEFCVEEGLYDTPEEANRRAKALGRLGVAFAVEKRTLLDAPGGAVAKADTAE